MRRSQAPICSRVCANFGDVTRCAALWRRRLRGTRTRADADDVRVDSGNVGHGYFCGAARCGATRIVVGDGTRREASQIFDVGGRICRHGQRCVDRLGFSRRCARRSCASHSRVLPSAASTDAMWRAACVGGVLGVISQYRRTTASNDSPVVSSSNRRAVSLSSLRLIHGSGSSLKSAMPQTSGKLVLQAEQSHESRCRATGTWQRGQVKGGQANCAGPGSGR